MYRLHCFSLSGNCFKVAFLLRALGEPWEAVHVDYLKGTTRDEGWRGQTNEMGEAPVLEDGKLVLTQSGAILTYLAAKHGRYGGASDAERIEVLRWLLFDNHKFTSYFGSYRFANVAQLEAGIAQQYDYSFSVTSDPKQAAKFKVRQFGFYAGDTWRVHPKLTLTYGARFDIPTFPDTPSRNPVSEELFGYRTDEWTTSASAARARTI